MKAKTFLVWVLFAVAAAAFGGANVPSPVKARLIPRPPVLDGFLDEEVWTETEPFTAFRQVFPSPDADPSEKTELRRESSVFRDPLFRFRSRPDLGEYDGP
jgi:hypothetical protein